jgi:hypothetical protein
MRTTLDLDKPVLDGLKALQSKRRGSLSELASSLLAEALKRHETAESASPPARLDWTTANMGAKIDISDTELLHRTLDES